MIGQAARELVRALRLPANSQLECLQAPQDEPGRVGRRDRTGAAAEALDAVV